MIRMLVGLGNPGEKYAATRHNIGFDVVNLVASELRALPWRQDRNCELTAAKSEHARAILAKPTTYMNRSGLALASLLDRFELEPEQMLVIVDDFALPAGAVRIRKSGSDGGHNGLASIIETIGAQSFPRMRLGLGEPPEGQDPADFVLEPFAENELKTVREMVAHSAKAAIFALSHPLDAVMTQFNRNPASPE